MPIECAVEIERMGQDRFHALDLVLTGFAFDLQNALGRLCDERIYQMEFAARCLDRGIRCQREVEIRIRHRTFEKSYFLDVLVEAGSIYELKTVEALAPAHQNQLINYLLLAGIHHGKLFNFRSTSVETRFVSTRLNRADRLDFHICESGWLHSEESTRLKSTLIALLEDWGAFLDLNLYREALLHLLADPCSGYLPVPIEIGTRAAGSQKMCLLNSECAWHLSAIKATLHSHEIQLTRLLHHTPLKHLHWINLHRNQITLKSLHK